MSSTVLEHFSHPEHQLILKENDVIEENATCSVCNKTVIGFPTYTCSHDDDDIRCKNFYLHRSCAELPKQIYHDTHNRHPLTLQLRPDKYYCDVCDSKVKFAYACDDCDFDLCVVCAFPCPTDDDEQRALSHEGHQEHTLTLQRQALFKCDACWEETKDFSYVCITCDFWIHKRCAFSPLIIPAPTYHHHPLQLTYSIPQIHRIFVRTCGICEEPVHVHSWFYYCHKCTYFVHIKCATSSVPKLNENEAAGSDTDPDLIEFPLASEESLFDLITTQCSKLQVDSDDDLRKDTITRSTEPNDLHIIEEHWSHSYHPLEQLQFITSENDDDNDDNTKVLICDGCIKPISLTYTSYYGCIQCGFFLHSVCATKLPKELPAGVSQIHPQHSLHLEKRSRFYSLVRCGVCGFRTNGFYYECETCDIIIDICCAFLPARIKHKSHKHHPLVQRPSSGSLCSVTKFRMSGGMEYACEICNNFRIGMECVFCPSTIRHKYDDHAISLRDPPFSYEGAFYCETCEEPVNNQISLFHCGECDHSFHWRCSRMQSKIKLGGTIQLDINNELHTLAFVFKWNTRSNSPLYVCGNCGVGWTSNYFFECDGCGILICIECVSQIYGD